MNNLLAVAEGILDPGAREYIDTNLATIEAVQDYADACDISLTREEAAQIMNVCKAWVEGVETGGFNGSNDYYYSVKKPLLGDEATL